MSEDVDLGPWPVCWFLLNGWNQRCSLIGSHGAEPDLSHIPTSSTHHRILSWALLFVGDALRPGILSVAVKIDLGTVGIWHGSVQYDPVTDALASSTETWNGWPSCQLLEKFLKEAEYWNKKTIPKDGDKSGFMTSFESSRWFYDAKARSVPTLSGSMDLTSMLALFKWIWLGSVVLVIEMFPLMYVIWLIASFTSPLYGSFAS